MNLNTKTPRMNPRIPTNLRLRNPARAALTLAVCLAWAVPQATACDACNIAFGKALEGERSDSLIAQDFQKAARNQSGARLDGLGSGAFRPQLASATAEDIEAARAVNVNAVSGTGARDDAVPVALMEQWPEFSGGSGIQLMPYWLASSSRRAAAAGATPQASARPSIRARMAAA